MLIKIKFYCITAFLLASSLEASQCRFPERLIDWASNQFAPESNLFLASQIGSGVATEQLLQLALTSKQNHWLSLLAENGSARAHYELALVAERPSLKTQHLIQAANAEYAPALFELGISDTSPSTKVQYLTDAAQQDFFAAKKALYQWHWFHEDYERGLPWLEMVADADHQAALTLALYLWRSGNHDGGSQWFEKAQILGSTEAVEYQNLIKSYWKKKTIKGASKPTNQQMCSMNLQFVANSLDSVKQAHNYYKEFEKDQRFANMPICLNQPIWIEEDAFACQSRPTNNYRITCSLAYLDNVLGPADFSHLVIFSEQGKANVVNGVMYLDLADKYSVFIHELAHFVGFIDEYPLSAEFAGFFCNGEQVFPNIVVVPDEQTLSDVDLSYWQQQNLQISLARANTCNNHPAQAFKFSSKLTFMEYHDTDNIPEIYLETWKQRLLDKSHVRIAAINIAQALEENGNSPAAEKWWQAYELWRSQ